MAENTIHVDVPMNIIFMSLEIYPLIDGVQRHIFQHFLKRHNL